MSSAMTRATIDFKCFMVFASEIGLKTGPNRDGLVCVEHGAASGADQRLFCLQSVLRKRWTNGLLRADPEAGSGAGDLEFSGNGCTLFPSIRVPLVGWVPRGTPCLPQRLVRL